MARRRVTPTAKSKDGTITGLGNPRTQWYSRTTAQAIRDIESGAHAYHVGKGRRGVDIQVVEGKRGKYLSTVAIDEEADNLDELPDLELQPATTSGSVAMRQLLGG